MPVDVRVNFLKFIKERRRALSLGLYASPFAYRSLSIESIALKVPEMRTEKLRRFAPTTNALTRTKPSAKGANQDFSDPLSG
jgi:hypothetical protein